MKRLTFALLIGLAACPSAPVDPPEVDAGPPCAIPCNGVCCKSGQVCDSKGKCAAKPCVPQCAGRECGDDGCGDVCGTCPTGSPYTCTEDGWCQPCTRQCTNKVCGADGCGGTCGQCGAGELCRSGACEKCTPSCTGKTCGPDGCGGLCAPGCGATGVCDFGTGTCACEKSCTGKECGPDGCGGVCGTCAGGSTCGTDGKCQLCEPACTDKECGPDGCGGTCGSCATGEACVAGRCEGCTGSCSGKECGDDGCGTSCGTCSTGLACSAQGQCVCTPACSGKQCGDDGCGGSCGVCTAPATCNATGQCVGPANQPPVVDTLTISAVITQSAGATVSATVSDPDGPGDLSGGILRDPRTGKTVKAFNGSVGTYSLTLAWADFSEADRTFGTSGASLDLEAVFYDRASASGARTLAVKLACRQTGYSGCSGSCFDLANDLSNCGACGRKAPVGGVCTNGVPGCATGQVVCGDRCADLSTDSSNCGACGKSCSTWAVSLFGSAAQYSASCAAGSCNVQADTTSAVSCNTFCSGKGTQCKDLGRCHTFYSPNYTSPIYGGCAEYFQGYNDCLYDERALSCTQAAAATVSAERFAGTCSLTKLTCYCAERACTKDTDCPGSAPVCDLTAKLCVQCNATKGCSGATPYCELSTHTCSACTATQGCSGATPVCDLLKGACVGCTQAQHCAAPKPLCDTTRGVCVACFGNSDCPGTAPTCTNGLCVAAGSCLPGVVISQFYGDGGNGGASWLNDYVELHNRTGAAVDLLGWTLQYAGATSTNWSATPLTGTLASGGYYLVKLGSAGTVGSALPTAQATGTTNLSATAGKLALVATMTDLVDACPLRADVVDFVGYGSTATCYRGTGPAPDPSPTLGATRGDSGCAHSGNNDADFANETATPHNSASPAKACTCP